MILENVCVRLGRDKVVLLVTKSMKNPRSALCKTAIMVSADIFKGYHEHLLDILDPLVPFHLFSTASANLFSFHCFSVAWYLVNMIIVIFGRGTFVFLDFYVSFSVKERVFELEYCPL